MYIKTTEQHKDGVISIYTPVNSSSILRIVYYPEIPVIVNNNPENPVESTEEVQSAFIVIEHPILTTTMMSVKLQRLRRIKQTKQEEIFEVTEPHRVSQAMFTKVEHPQEIADFIEYLESNLAFKDNTRKA